MVHPEVSGEPLAEVWFKPEGEPRTLRFRIPQRGFQIPGVGPLLTTENLLKAVGVAPEDVESWRHGDVPPDGSDGAASQLRAPLPQPSADVAHLEVSVRLKSSPQAGAGGEAAASSGVVAQWPDAEARWKTVLGLEATVDTSRIGMEGLRAEMEGAFRRPLMAEEKLHALSADVVQWNKAKTRLHYAVPKAKEFIHRATWARGTPERKRLDELFTNVAKAHTPSVPVEQVLDELEALRKDLQQLSAQGVTVYQECKSILADVQGALRRLQSNAAARAAQKKGSTGARGKPR